MATRRALRIGIVHNGQIVEERLLRRSARVTLGSARRNTVVLPGLPPSVRVLEPARDGYRLHFTADRSGRVQIGGVVLSLTEAVDQGLARRRGLAHVLTLPGDTRGRITIDDVTVLFQIVDAPAPAAVALPRSLRRRFGWPTDRGWTLSLSASAVGQLLMALYLVTLDVPQAPQRLDDLPDRWADVIITQPTDSVTNTSPEVTVEAPEVPSVPTDPAGEAPEKPVVTVATPRVEAPAAALGDARLDDIKRRTVLGQIGTKGGTGPATLEDILGPSVALGDMDRAWEGTTAVAMNDDGARRPPRGPAATTGATVGIAPVRVAKGGGRVRTGTKAPEVRVVGRVEPKPPQITSGRALDAAAIARVVAGETRRVQACFERALKKDPGISGKVTLSFAIQGDGRVRDTYVLGDTAGSRELSQCLVRRARRWRFPASGGEPTVVSYPFVFTPST